MGTAAESVDSIDSRVVDNESVLQINAGLGGRCCHLRMFDSNWFKGRVPQLSPVFYATGQE